MYRGETAGGGSYRGEKENIIEFASLRAGNLQRFFYE